MKLTNKKKNERRKFFNKDVPHCDKCGSKLVEVKNLQGDSFGLHCPLNHP